MDQEEQSTWDYKPDGGQASKDEPDDSKQSKSASRHRLEPVRWQAPEYIEHDHNAGWYAALFIITLGLAALAFLVIKDTFASVIIVLLGIIVGVFAAQKPAKAEYEISSSGLSIGGKLYGYSNYKSFTVIREGQYSSVNLFPIKRLMPPVSAYFDPKDETKITKVVGEYLAYEERKIDAIDRLAWRLRL